KAGVIDWIGTTISKVGGSGKGSTFIVYSIIVWASVIISAFVDNIPYTATMLPVVAVISESLSATGTAVSPKLLYYGLLIGATLGGNLTPIGASANIAGIGILRKEGYEVKSSEFMKFGIPITLSAVITGYLLVWLVWCK
ncbi:MAG: arsenic transporter, partial [Clostridiales bacterium]|nr:arsenic transporter [Clostridiales bacterium]